MSTYRIQDAEAGNIIERGITTEAEAMAILAQYEDQDRKDGTYTQGFYEIILED